jgi:hypothetical protein
VTQPLSAAGAAGAPAAAQRTPLTSGNASAGPATSAQVQKSGAQVTDRTDPALFQILDRLEQLLSQQHGAQLAKLGTRLEQLEVSVRSALDNAGSKQTANSKQTAREPSGDLVSRTDFEGLRVELRSIGVVARGLESVLAGKGELEKLKGLVTKLVDASAQTPGSAVAPTALEGLAKKTDLDDHRHRLLARLPSKSDIEALLKQNAASPGASADLGALEQRLSQLPSKAEVETLLKQGAGNAAKGADLGPLELRVSQLPSKAEVEALLKQGAASATKGADLAALEQRLSQLPSKAEFAAVQKQLAQLPSKAELEAIQKQLAGLPSKQELKALQDALAALPSRADLDKLAKSVELSAQPAQSPARRSKPPGKTARAAAEADVKPPVSVAPSAPPPHASEPPSRAETSSEPAAAVAAAKPASAAPPALSEAKPEKKEAEVAAAQAPAEAAPKPEPEVKPVAAEPELAAEAAAKATAEAEATPAAAAEPGAVAEPVATKAAPAAEPAATPAEEPSAAPKDDKPDLSADPEHQNAARAARVMVSDLLLYHKDDVDGGIKDGAFLERNKDALADMKATYESRVPKHVREHKDYLQEAIDNFIANRRKRLGLG